MIEETWQEAEMASDGWQSAIVAAHDAETLPEAASTVGGGGTLAEVVYEGFWEIDILAGMLETADAPLKIGRIAIAGVVGHGYAHKHDKGLMAYDHAMGKGFVGERGRRGEMARAEITALGIHEVGLTVDNTGKIILHDSVGYVLQSVGRMESIACIEEDEIFAGSAVHTLVHGIVDAAVGFGCDACAAGGKRTSHLEGIVPGSTVYNQMLVVATGLLRHTAHGDSDGIGGIVAHGDYGE